MGISSFRGAGGNARHVVFLQPDEQKHDRDGHHHRSGAENGVVFVDIGLVHHGVQALGHGIVVVIVLHDDRNEDKIHPRRDEGVDGGIGHDGLGVGQNDLPEDRVPGGPVQRGGFVQRAGQRIEEALGDVVVQPGAAGVDQNQRQQGLIQPHGLHEVVDGEKIEKIQNECKILNSLTEALKAIKN